MRSIIVGCGRVGAGLASRLAREGHEVTIIDLRTEAFARLPSSFPGADNRNILAAQLAGRTLGVSNVLAKINDPMRAEAYAALGIDTLCRTTMMVDAIARFMGYPPDPGAMDVHATEGHPLGSEHGHASDGPAGAPARASQPSRED
jgi:Trk K+ transport system NAD-binding subunit